METLVYTMVSAVCTWSGAAGGTSPGVCYFELGNGPTACHPSDGGAFFFCSPLSPTTYFPAFLFVTEVVTSTDGTGGAPVGLFDEFKKEVNAILDKGVAILETEQSRVNKALFEALNMQQRDVFCQSLRDQGVKSSRIEKIIGKSQPTVNRHLNGKTADFIHKRRTAGA